MKITAPKNVKKQNSPAVYLGLFALILALATAGIFGLRLINSPDIGYHLDYGNRFFEDYHPVDASPNIYTISKNVTENEQLPPCCWRDCQGQFHFPNANWLSQILFSAVYRLNGFNALSVLGSILILAAAACSAATVYRAGVPLYWTAPAILLIVAGSYERFCLRPEMLAFALLAAQLYLLTHYLRQENGLTGRHFFLLTLLHLIFVNIHSYWILSLGITTAFLADSLLKDTWQKKSLSFRSGKTPLLALLLLSQILASLINPWSWRLALLPIKTGIFMIKNNIVTHQLIAGHHPWMRCVLTDGHPWSIINEFLPAFHTGFLHSYATWAFIAILVLSLAAGSAAIFIRQWWAIIIIIGIVWFSLAMRRNIAPASFVLVPVSFIVLFQGVKKIKSRRSGFLIFFQSIAIPVGISVISVLLMLAVISNRFYVSSNQPYRFGVGPANMALPLGACKFLSQTTPSGRIWTDFFSSSNVHFFTRPRPEVPVLTNTWAMPVNVMADVIDIMSGQTPLHRALQQYNFQTAVLSLAPCTTIPFPEKKEIPLARAMVLNPRWKLVYLDAAFAVFIYNQGKNADIADRYGIRLNEQWLANYTATLKNADPVETTGYLSGAFVLRSLGYKKWANRICQKVRDTKP